MALIVRENKTDYIESPEGFWRSVCIDAVDLGLRQTAHGLKPRVKLVWEIEESMEDGQPFIVMQTYGKSLHKQSNLRKMLESWRAKKFNDEELAGFDLDRLIGVPCQTQITHAPREGGGVWANVTAVAPLSKGMEKLVPRGKYIRVQDRPKTDDPQNGESHEDNDSPVF